MDESFDSYVAGLREAERALSNYSLLDFIRWRRRMRNNKDIQKRNKMIRIEQIEQHMREHQGELDDLEKEG
jgi:hypothetical protein